MANRILFCVNDFVMPQDLLLIILGGTICIAYYAWQDYKRKKEEKRQDRLNRIKVDND